MGKTHADKIREAVTDLGLAKPNEIMEWIKRHYPDDPVNPQSYRADIIGCSVNHTSAHHYPGMPRLLWFEKDAKKYRLVNPDEAKAIENDNISLPDIDDKQQFIDGIPVAELSVTGQVHIPSIIVEKMGLKKGDLLAFIINDKGILEIRRARIRLEFE